MDADAINALLDRGAVNAPAIDTPDGGKAIAVPATHRMHELRPAWPKLERIRQSVTLHDQASFSAYVNRYKTDRTRLFAEPGFLANGNAHVTAVIDYHAPDHPDYGAHVATYRPRYSDQWKRWTAIGDMGQAEFAEWIEDNRTDIRTPEAAQLLDIVRTFKASKSTEFDSVVYMPNGDTTLAYSEKTTQKGSVAMPTELKLGIPCYFRGTIYSVPVLVKYRVGGGKVTFSMKVDRADIIEDAAFQEATKAIGESTAIEVYLGKP